jgi:hypothetical protein
MAKEIDRVTHWAARGLFELARANYLRCRESEAALLELLGYEDYADTISDQLYGDGNFDKAMKQEGFVIKKAKKAA